MTDEQRDLDNLLKHPGWQLVEKAARAEIDGRLNDALARAADNSSDLLALNLVRQGVAVKRAIEAFLTWPRSRLKVLQERSEQRSNTVPQLSRRGDL
jgi:hypothetical protein